MNKSEFIKSLPHVKLVLGNGFDLHCGLHTKYDDYFDIFYFEKYMMLKKLFEQYKNDEQIDFAKSIGSKYRINVWDLFMVVNSQIVTKRKRWCDIESTMTASFKNPNLPENNNAYLPSNIFWKEMVKKTTTLLNNSKEANFIKEFIKINNGSIVTTKEYYDYLLDELKIFEKEFGDFVKKQVVYKDYTGYKYLNSKYVDNAMFVINQLCNQSKISTIDTFNYTIIPGLPSNVPFHHINGSFEKPIFGIDSIFKPGSQEFVFTKTSRRMDNDILDETYDVEKYFENIIIFGHSLNEADYNYFFPLFDKIGLLDSSRTSVVVFAYNQYEKDNININKRVFDLVYAYADDKDYDKPERLLDSLTTQRRILTYEVKNVLSNKNGYTDVFDLNWNKTVKNAENTRMISDYKKTHTVKET